MKGNQLILVAFCRKNSNMEIFGRHIFGSDAQQFIDLCFDDQVKWIEKYTNQRDKEQIKLLLDNIAIGKEKECLDCRKKRENYGSNISQGISETDKSSNKHNSTSGTSKRGTNKRGKQPKTS